MLCGVLYCSMDCKYLVPERWEDRYASNFEHLILPRQGDCSRDAALELTISEMSSPRKVVLNAANQIYGYLQCIKTMKSCYRLVS
jgi:hypothetical protein